MNIAIHADDETHHELVVRERNAVVQRLGRALEALERKRQRVTEVVQDLASFIPAGASSDEALPSAPPRRARAVLYGAIAGGAVFAVALLVEHRRRERNKPLRVVQRAWFRYALPPSPSLFARFVTDAVGSLVMSFAQEAARAGVQRLLDARALPDDGPEILDRVSDSPDPRFVPGSATDRPAAPRPREATLPSVRVTPPEAITPLPSPLREFT